MMQAAFKNPPASVHDTFLAYFEHYGIKPADLSPDESARVLEIVAFTYTCAVGRMTAKLPPPEHCRRNTDAIALQMRDEALQVLREVAHATESTPPCGPGLNA